MTNTVPNVSRELLERASNLAFQTQHYPLHEELRTLLSAPSSANHVEDVRAMVADPSPAGVDGLNTDRNAAFKACPEAGCDWGSFYLGWKARGEVEQAIIDGLRGEVADLHTTMMAAAVEIQEHWAAHCDEEGYGPANLMHRLERGIASQYGYSAETLVRLESQRDQQAQRIGELASHLEFAVTMLTVAGLDENAQVEAMRAALSAGKEGE